MATLTLGDFSDALSQVFGPNIISQINLLAIGLNLIPTVPGAGKNAAWTAKLTGRTNAAGYVEGADMADVDFDSEKREDAVLAWAEYRKGAKVSGLAQAAAASNLQPGSVLSEGLGDLFSDEVTDAIERLALGMGTNLYNGTGGGADPMIGLETAVAAAGVYAGIDPGVDPEWASTVQSIPTGDLSFSKLRAFITAIYKASGRRPDLLLTDPDTFDKIGDLYGDGRRWMESLELSNGQGGRREIKLVGGYRMLEFDGIGIAQDNLATSDAIWGLNTRFIQIKQLSSYKSPMTLERFLAIMEAITGERLPMESMGEMTAAPGQLVPYVEMLGKLGDSDRAQIKCYSQLCVNRRNAHGRLNLV